MRTFRKLCRERTPTSILDSGDHYGRHFEGPPIPEDSPAIIMDTYTDRDGYIHPEPMLETGAFLDSLLDIRDDLTDKLLEFSEDRSRSEPWKDTADAYMQNMGFVRPVRWDNSYNWETHLSQEFQIAPYTPRLSSGDWIYNSETLLALQIHTGCDVRGGYTHPVIAKPSGRCPEDALHALLDCVIGVRFSEGFDPKKKVGISRNNLHGLDNEYQIGYSSDPLYRFENDVERYFGWTLDRENNSVWCKLESGEVVKAHFYSSVQY